jgi:ATP-dependent exoDNAse (exonuclease V) alpha subunit
MAEGGRLTSLRNDSKLEVQNGTLGIVERIDVGHMVVRLDASEPRTIALSVADYPHIDHGYAATSYTAQGLTAERAQVLATPHFDQHGAYPGLGAEGPDHQGRDVEPYGRTHPFSLPHCLGRIFLSPN